MLKKLIENLLSYKEELELLELQRKELFEKNKELKRTLKTVESLKSQGIEVNVPSDLTKSVDEVANLDKDRKILKSIIRRYESVIEFYSIESDELKEDVEESKEII